MQSLFYVLITYSIVFLLFCNAWKCDYYFKYHEELGLSVYAGNIFESFDVFDIGVGVPVPLRIVYSDKELVNYVEGYNSSHALLTLGLGMLLNHNENPTKVNVRKYLSEDPSLIIFPSNQEPSIDIRFEYSSSISIGDQLFVHYGEEWFDERGMTMIDTHKYLTDQEELAGNHKFPGCVRHYAKLVDGKLVAKRNISEGIVIEVVRSIFLSASPQLREYVGPFSDVLWWTGSPPLSSTASASLQFDGTSTGVAGPSHGVLMSGYGAFYGIPNSETTANVRYEWDSQLLPNNPTEEQYPKLLKFIANRFISKGEELLLSESLRDASLGRRILRK